MVPIQKVEDIGTADYNRNGNHFVVKVQRITERGELWHKTTRTLFRIELKEPFIFRWTAPTQEAAISGGFDQLDAIMASQKKEA